jgi:threonylcarbamoyladenosine tRNA methylthiotransferase MtaB
VRVFFSNLGCKLNQAELEALARGFAAAGHRVVSSLTEADLHVVNSCTVTHLAARDSRKVARRGRRLNPRLRTVLTGCHVAAVPDESAALAGVDLVVANNDKERLVERVHAAFPEATAAGTHDPVPVPYVPLEFGNSRALVKIEDGCDMRCSFCVIPLTRGGQRSRPADEVVREVAALAASGSAEIVVTGVQISSYRDRQSGLFELVSRLLRETDVPRLRLTSIAPWEFDARLLELFAGRRLCRHFHLSLQSGSDSTLRRMRRPYTSERFAHLVETIRDAVPGVAVTTDVIVGFPGESEREFEQSLAFCRRIGFARLHAFPFSPRPGTAAAGMPNQVPHVAKRERMAALLETARRDRRRFEHSQIGSLAEALWEDRRHGCWRGTTDNYLRVSAIGSLYGARPQALQEVRIAAMAEGGLTVAPPDDRIDAAAAI